MEQVTCQLSERDCPSSQLVKLSPSPRGDGQLAARVPARVTRLRCDPCTSQSHSGVQPATAGNTQIILESGSILAQG